MRVLAHAMWMDAHLHPLIERLRREPGNRVKGIAAVTGIPYGTLRKWREPNRQVDPRTSNLDRLRWYYAEQPIPMVEAA